MRADWKPAMSKTFRVQSGKNTLMSPWPLMRSSQSWQRFAFICAWLSRFKRKPNQNFLSKGRSSVQRIWKGHRCCQSLLSWLDGLWFVFFAFVNNSQACCLAEFERSPKMTWFDFISSFGGFCGLCLGISFVSVIELFYWFSIRLCRNLARWTKNVL